MTIFFETRDNIHVMLSIDQMKKKNVTKLNTASNDAVLSFIYEIMINSKIRDTYHLRYLDIIDIYTEYCIETSRRY